MVLRNLTLRSHQFTESESFNPDFSGYTIGIMIERGVIDETIDRIFYQFKLSFYYITVVMIAVTSILTFIASNM